MTVVCKSLSLWYFVIAGRMYQDSLETKNTNQSGDLKHPELQKNELWSLSVPMAHELNVGQLQPALTCGPWVISLL